MAEMCDETHFENFALIEGQIVRYSEMTDGDHGSNFEDAVYLGEGKWHHANVVRRSTGALTHLDKCKALARLCEERMEWPDVVG